MVYLSIGLLFMPSADPQKAIKHSAGGQFSADRYFFKCKNLSRYLAIHGSKRTLLYPGEFDLYVSPKAIPTFKLRRNIAY